MSQKIVGVILAAGNANRMHPLNQETSKTIMPILNTPLLEYHIKSLKKVGIKNIIIVIGTMGYKIVEAIGDGSRFGVNIKYIEQEKRLGIAHAVGSIERYIKDPFILILGDIFFVTDGLKGMVDKFFNEKLHCVLSTKIDTPENIRRNFAVIEDEKGFVKRVIEKPRYIENNIKGCGIYMFSLNIFDAIRRTPRTAQRDEYEITNAIQILIDDGFKAKKINNIIADLNLTYPHDLLEINLKELERLKKKVLIGKNLKVKDNKNIQNCVIGNNVFIKGDIKLNNCLIFSNTKVSSKHDLDYMILTPYNHVDCKAKMKHGS